jgi:signal transduction histidine kinase
VRRRIERNLHDGTQQRHVSLGFALHAAEAALPPGRDDLRDQLSGVAMGLVSALEDLQEISRGIHPAILSKGGLGPALQALAYRSAIPVALDIRTDERVAEQIEVAAFGGSIHVTSRPGQGTQIAAEFPRELELPEPVGVSFDPRSGR